MTSWLQQFEELRLRTPRMALHNMKGVNSDYVNWGVENKNCYLLVSAVGNEDCYFGYRILECKDCTDNQNIKKCVLCYECSDCVNLYSCNFCQDCADCADCLHCYDMKGCSDCFGCVGLRHKKYHIYNEEFSREEYFKKLPKVIDEKKYEELKLRMPRMYAHIVNAENCVGDYLYYSKNCFHCFITEHAEDCGYVFNSGQVKDCWDIDYDDESQLNYEILSGQDTFNCTYCFACWYSSNMTYCDLCQNCSDCMLCVGLNKRKFNILNEPYSEEEYKKKSAEIKKEMIASGEFGDWFTSTFPHEDSAAAIYMK